MDNFEHFQKKNLNQINFKLKLILFNSFFLIFFFYNKIYLLFIRKNLFFKLYKDKSLRNFDKTSKLYKNKLSSKNLKLVELLIFFQIQD